MGRGKETHKLRLEERYRNELKGYAGSQQALGDLSGVDQSTVSRALSGGPVTYDTAMKLADAVSDMPPPLVMMQSIDHYRWCQLGALLLKASPERFAKALSQASDQAALVGVSDDEWNVKLPELSADAIDKIGAVFKNPLRADRRKR